MAFMYLHLTAKDDGVHAEVRNSGELKFSSLGTPSGQRSDYPFSVMRIESFTGLSAINEELLLTEILRRYSTKELLHSFGLEFTNEELVALLKDRLRE